MRERMREMTGRERAKEKNKERKGEEAVRKEEE